MRRCLISLALRTASPGSAAFVAAAPAPDDPYLAGYAGAVLELEFKVREPPPPGRPPDLPTTCSDATGPDVLPAVSESPPIRGEGGDQGVGGGVGG